MGKKLMILLMLCFIVSCSDNLTNSKAKKLIKECDTKYPKNEVVYIQTGNNLSLSEEKVTKYKQLEKDGLLSIKKQEKNNFNQTLYSIEFSEKGKKYIDTSKHNFFGETGSRSKVITYKLKLKSVSSIHEIPAMNAAEVATTYEREPTPFSVLKPNAEKEKSAKVTLLKTNEGWIACDNR